MNEHKKQSFQTEMGQKVRVVREEHTDEGAGQANHMLAKLGEMLNPIDKSLNYVGSAAVHIYQSEVLGQIFFLSQTGALGDTHEVTASTALDALRGDLMEAYGRKRKVKRSGF